MAFLANHQQLVPVVVLLLLAFQYSQFEWELAALSLQQEETVVLVDL
jgi:hypothetical protein